MKHQFRSFRLGKWLWLYYENFHGYRYFDGRIFGLEWSIPFPRWWPHNPFNR